MTDTYNEKFADRVAQLSNSKFKSLGKTGKPKEHTEWTLLACILQLEEGNMHVVSLGTGSKCIGASQLSGAGDILHDSHAEVVARRAFVLYLIEQVDRAVKGQESLFQEEKGKYVIREGVTFHFYVSHTPCGDASIFPKQEWAEYYGDCLETSCTQQHNTQITQKDVCDTHPVTFEQDPDSLIEAHKARNEFEQPAKKLKKNSITSTSTAVTYFHQSKCEEESPSESWLWAVTEKSDGKSKKNPVTINKSDHPANQDIHRTGAKTVGGEHEDPRLPGADYHVTGALRTKPGRGDPTLSMSCSDKIFKWTVLGVQGALLMLFLKSPVYFETITIGKCPYSQEAMLRALFSRFESKLKNVQLPEGFRVVTPHLLSSSIGFPFSRDSVTCLSSNPSKVMPSPTCLIWSNTSTHQGKHEVATNGRKHGITKKAIGTPKSWVSVCCKSLLLKIKDIAHNDDQCDISNRVDFTNHDYGTIKALASSYYQTWNELRTNVLDNWTVKPSFVKAFKA